MEEESVRIGEITMSVCNSSKGYINNKKKSKGKKNRNGKKKNKRKDGKKLLMEQLRGEGKPTQRKKNKTQNDGHCGKRKERLYNNSRNSQAERKLLSLGERSDEFGEKSTTYCSSSEHGFKEIVPPFWM